MYYPIGSPTNLSPQSSDDVFSIIANTDKSLFALLSHKSLSLWYCRPSVMIVTHARSDESIRDFGDNCCAVWRPDSTMIVVQTLNDYLLFYRIELRNANNTILEQKDVNIAGLKRESAELYIHEKIPALTLHLSYSVQMKCGIICLMAAEEEVVIGNKQSEICGVNWDGTMDNSFVWNLNPSQFTYAINDSPEFNVIDLKYSSMIGGFSLVFSNGRAAFMPLHSQVSQPSTPEAPSPSYYSSNSRLQFVHEIDNAICTAINHKYQLIAYGLKNTEGILCCLDDTTNTNTTTVVSTHKLVLSSSTYPNANLTSGAMINLQWTHDSTVLATAWERGGFALWSVFGALICCSLSWDFGFLDNVKSNQFRVLSLAWGKEGYHLWLVTKNASKTDDNGHLVFPDGLSKISIAKSVLASNASCACSSELVLLTADDRLFVGVGAVNVGQQYSSPLRRFNYINGGVDEDVLPSTNVSSAEMHYEQQPVAVGNHQWIVISMPQSYLSTNWPIRYAAIDSQGQHLAIAGRSGMAHYSLVHRKWKLFGNETQEKDFEVCGGLLWWDDHVVLSCFNAIDTRYEIRAYPQKTKLDNQYVRVAKVPTEVLLMSMFSNRMLTFLIDGTFHLFGFHQKLTGLSSSASKPLTSSLHIIYLNQIVICNLIVPPECVTSLVLTNLHIETRKTSERDNDNSILMNVCGRLFLLEREPLTNRSTDRVNNNTNQSIVYKGVSILASGVENIWVSNMTNKSDRPHLTESLWLSCGCNGMGVWLPLVSGDSESQRSHHNFMSKRIMLPITTQIYPLAVLFRDAVVLGAENDTIACSRSLPLAFPLSIVSRTSQVYLHHILRELLRRNLGFHAWEIANSCATLPYFPHSLELLLHEVLEEEATSSHPIPDALLPRVIDFIREFPVFLQTVVHCARKTELALWAHLFAVVGNPRELFQKCLAEGQLETAASYIIILQNLERTSISRQHATLLLDAALNAGCWELAKDLLRFLRAIDPMDIETPPSKTSIVTAGGTSHPYTMKYVIAPSALGGDSVEGFSQVQAQPNQGTTGRKRTQSTSSSLMLHQGDACKPLSTQEPHNNALPQRRNSLPKSSNAIPNPSIDDFYLDTILSRHAHQLLYDGRLKDLGQFAAHLDFHLVSFLTKERFNAAKVDDFVNSLIRLHADFEWPQPFINPVSGSPAFMRKDSGSSATPSLESCTNDVKSIKLIDKTNDSHHISDKISMMNIIDHKSDAISKVSIDNLNMTKEINLMPKNTDTDSLKPPSEESSSLYGNDTQIDDDILWLNNSHVDAMAQELISSIGGSPIADVQLRYLLQLMLEAECLCWSFLIAMVLRDVLAVSRVINAARQPEMSREMIIHLKNGIESLQQWVSNDVFNGYRSFMHQVKSQIKMLYDILAQKTSQSLTQLSLTTSLSNDIDLGNDILFGHNNNNNNNIVAPISSHVNHQTHTVITNSSARPGTTTRTYTSGASVESHKSVAIVSPSPSLITNPSSTFVPSSVRLNNDSNTNVSPLCDNSNHNTDLNVSMKSPHDLVPQKQTENQNCIIS